MPGWCHGQRVPRLRPDLDVERFDYLNGGANAVVASAVGDDDDDDDDDDNDDDDDDDDDDGVGGGGGDHLQCLSVNMQIITNNAQHFCSALPPLFKAFERWCDASTVQKTTKNTHFRHGLVVTVLVVVKHVWELVTGFITCSDSYHLQNQQMISNDRAHALFVPGVNRLHTYNHFY